jgi:hypothetical protein
MSLVLFNPVTIGVYFSLLGNTSEFSNLLLLLIIPTGLTMIDIINIYIVPKFKASIIE